MGYKIVLTCDRTMASNYHSNMFFGFSACLPQGVVPDWFYYPVFCPSGKSKDGRLLKANYGIRKIEAALLANGFDRNDVIVAHPDHLDKVIDNSTRILSISANDPLGIGPATSTFVELWGGEGRMAVKLRELLNDPMIQRYKPKILLGGPGAWQLDTRPQARIDLGIDYVVVGEGEVTAPKIFRDILEGHDLPGSIQGEPADESDIADIQGGTVCGLIEATRGCARSCAFCVPSLKKVRSRPIENIMREIQVTVNAGNRGIILHGEDIFLYQSDGLKVNHQAVVDLFSTAYQQPGVKWVSASHASLSSAVSSPQTVEAVSRVLELGTEKHPTKAFQVGVETGSPKLIARHMKGKVYPFQPEQWPETVYKGFKLFHDNHIVSCSTVILGLPGEDKKDIELTIELIRSLKSFQSLIVPLLFTPMDTTRLESSKPLHKKELTPDHYKLLADCWEHNLDWFPALWTNYKRDNHFVIKMIVDLLIKIGTEPIRKRIHKNAIRHGAIL